MQVTATDALHESLTRDLFALASYLMRHANYRTFSAIGELELSMTQIKALCALEEEQEGVSVKSLADHLGVSLPTTSRAVDGLFERGFVAREEDASDRRMKRVRLTDEGRRVPRLLNESRLTALGELIATLGEEEAGVLHEALALLLERREDIAAYRPDENGASR